MQPNIKLQIVQQFDPETDYSSYDEAELEGAFEATIYELLNKSQSANFAEISIPDKGDSVQWKYGKGTGTGKVTKIYSEPITLKLGETDITRNGSEENPALLIVQTDGSQVLKLASEVKIIREVELEEPVIAYAFDFGGNYDHIDLTPTKGMIEAAKQAQKYIADGFAGDGMERETIRWVNLVAQGKPLSLEKAKKGYKFFQRHDYFKRTKNAGDTNPSSPAPWYVARLAWFGDDGESFFNRVWRQIKAVDEGNTEMNEPLEFGAIIHNVIKWNGLDIGCEYKPGEVRFPGRKNSRKLRIGYGHIRGYRDNTGEAPDVYLAPEFFNDGTPSDRIFMVSQMSPEDGDFDEPKYMCGFPNMDAAKVAYLREMPQDYFGGIEEVSVSELAKYKKTTDFSELQIELAERFTELQIATSQDYSELKAELIQIKELLASPPVTGHYNQKIEDLEYSISEDNAILQRLDRIEAKIVEFMSPIQIQGGIITTEEIDKLADVSDETVFEAIKDWQENMNNYENLLSTKQEILDATITVDNQELSETQKSDACVNDGQL
jgi:hypothetical protein